MIYGFIPLPHIAYVVWMMHLMVQYLFFDNSIACTFQLSLQIWVVPSLEQAREFDVVAPLEKELNC